MLSKSKALRHACSVTARSFSSKQLPSFEYKVEELYNRNYLNVPRLPLPTVSDTLKRYLETVRPLATQEEFANTAALAESFQKTHAPHLHAELVKIANGDGYPYSYVEQFWDDMYLGGRFEVMVGSNPFYLFPDEANPAEQEQVRRAAGLTSSLVRWWQKVVAGNLEADMERDKPLCMYGYGNVFGATRVPAIGRDSMSNNFKRNHIVVVCNHQYFKVQVIGPDGRGISRDNLEKILNDIKAKANAQQGNVLEDVGILTAQERDFWAKTRANLIAGSAQSKKTLEVVDDCLFVVALDNNNCTSNIEKANVLLHGGNGSNRWFDKHNVIATADGSLGMNFDHTFGDGLTWNRFLSEALADMKGKPSGLSPLPSPSDTFTGSFEELKWDLPDSVRKEMPLALENAEKLANDVDTYVLEFEDYGRERMKEMKMSPDAVCQMAFQLGYFKVHGKAPAVYESCAMKNFFHGRTETIRSCTSESVAMARAFLNDAGDDEKRQKLLNASKTHVEVAKGAKAALGPFQGVDRHLYAMKCIAQQQGIQVPFFQDPVYARSSTWVLSTSNVSAPFIHLFGFGAVCGHGYGLGYLTQKNNVPVNITSYVSNPETNSERLGEAIADSFRDFDKLFK